MKQSMLTAAAAAALVLSASAFTPSVPSSRRRTLASSSSSSLYSSLSLQPHDPNDRLPFFAAVAQEHQAQQQRKASTDDSMTIVKSEAAAMSTAAEVSPESPAQPAKSAALPKKAKTTEQQHKQGILSPVVLLAKQALGQDQLNKVRAKVISLHSDVIAAFVETSDSAVGQAVLQKLFNAADVNHNGVIEEEELALVFRQLGFDWLQDKQVKGILQRADADKNGAIDLDEFMREAPKTLRTNLIKLAKKNGGELGLLA